MKNSENSHSQFTDNPIENIDDDFFQRSEFANRISSLLIERKEPSSFALGIYGKWGEGKTSILNLIKKNILKSEVEPIDFNPWMFSSEEQLLTMFFAELTTKLNSISETKTEKAGKLIKDYASVIGNLTSLAGVNLQTGAEKLGSFLSEKTLLKQKDEINEALVEENRKYVVFIDDIDRLNSDELFTIFRLIKLTGEFKNIFYVLAFDDEIVAKMLADRYSGEGQSYLEKIIQLPLRIPKAQKPDLSKYFFTKLDLISKSTNFEIDKYDLDEIRKSFNLYMLPFTDNPRLIIRLINALEFILPLLAHQVNFHDLVLMEWIKIKYPNTYEVLKSNFSLLKENFSNNNKSHLEYDRPHYVKSDLKDFIKSSLENLTEFETRQLKMLIIKLFPHSKSSLKENYCQGLDYKLAYNQKRVCSPDYFERYFTYIVLEGQISDTEFMEFVADLINDDKPKRLTQFLNKTDSSDLAYKLSIFASTINDEYKLSFVKGLTKIADFFSTNGSFTRVYSGFSLIISIIEDVIKGIEAKFRIKEALYILDLAPNIKIAIELWYNLEPRKNTLDFLDKLTEEQFELLTKKIYEISKKDYTFEQIIDKLNQRYSSDLLKIWAIYDKDIKQLGKKYIEVNDENPIKLMRAFSNWCNSSKYPKPYINNFTTSNLSDLKKVVSQSVIEKRINSIYGKQNFHHVTDDFNPITNDQIVGIFQQYCRNYKRNLRKNRFEKNKKEINKK